MRKISLLFILLAFVVLGFSQEQASTNFRAMQWGARIDSIFIKDTKVSFVKDKNPIGSTRNAYVIENDDLSVGNVKMNKIDYVFNEENRFTKVLMEGAQSDANQMKFILDYKFGVHKNESRVDGVTYYQWLVRDVTFTLAVSDYLKFEVKIESNWQASEAYKKNTTVDDF